MALSRRSAAPLFLAALLVCGCAVAQAAHTSVPLQFRSLISWGEAVQFGLRVGSIMNPGFGAEPAATFLKLAALKVHFGETWPNHVDYLYSMLKTWPRQLLMCYNKVQQRIFKANPSFGGVPLRIGSRIYMRVGGARGVAAALAALHAFRKHVVPMMDANPNLCIYICAGDHSLMNELPSSQALFTKPLTPSLGSVKRQLLTTPMGHRIEPFNRLTSVAHPLITTQTGGRLTLDDLELLLREGAMGFVVLCVYTGFWARCQLFVGETAAMIAAWRRWPGRVFNLARSVVPRARYSVQKVTHSPQAVMATWVNVARAEELGFQVEVPQSTQGWHRNTTPLY